MANFGAALGNFGLMSQGYDAAGKVQQDRDLESQRIEGAKRSNVLQDQRIEEGRMGLEDATRQRGKAASIRKAGMSGSLLDMATAAEQSGDPELAFKYRQAHKIAEDEGIKSVVHAALTKPQPGYRPDLGEEFNLYGKSKVDPQSVTLDTNGNLSYQDPKTNERASINIGVTAERMGMVKPPEMKTIPAGGTGVFLQPGKPITTINAPKTFAEHPKEGYIVKKVKDAEGNERDQIIDVRPGSKTYGQEVSPSAAGEPSSPSVIKHRPVLDDITKNLLMLPGMSTIDPADMTGKPRPTPEGQRRAMLAEQLYMANREIAPQTIIDVATKGEPMWKIENGVRTGVIRYNGQEFPLKTPGKQQVIPNTITPRARTQHDLPQPARATPAKPEESPGLDKVTFPQAAVKPVELSPENKKRQEEFQAEKSKKTEAMKSKADALRKKLVAGTVTLSDKRSLIEAKDNPHFTDEEKQQISIVIRRLRPGL